MTIFGTEEIENVWPGEVAQFDPKIFLGVLRRSKNPKQKFQVVRVDIRGDINGLKIEHNFQPKYRDVRNVKTIIV
jgi:hypothetical protein